MLAASAGRVRSLVLSAAVAMAIAPIVQVAATADLTETNVMFAPGLSMRARAAWVVTCTYHRSPWHSRP